MTVVAGASARCGADADAEAVHEANNLLQAIAAEARLVGERTPPGPERALLERIVEQALAAGDVIARLSRGGELLGAPRPVSAGALVDAALELVEARARGARVQLERDVDPDLRVLARGSQLEHALVNLLVNGIQAVDGAGARDGRSRRVRVTARPGAPGRVRLSVRDDGPGVPPALRPLLLEARVTTKPRGEGSGLGLLLVRRIVEQHDGAVTIDSCPDGFTEVTLDLPAAADDA